MAGRKWEDKEISFIKENYLNMTCEEMAININRTTKAVQHRYNLLGLDRIIIPKRGEKFNRLEVIKTYSKKFKHQHKTYCFCICECGNYTHILTTNLVNNIVKSCGCWRNEQARKTCIRKNFKHGKANYNNNRLYRIWSAIKCRCSNSNTPQWNDYGGRGISICNEWKNDYLKFEEWALENGYSDKLSIDRIDVNGNYEPNNCRWATQKTQCRNRRNNRQDTVFITAFGETKSVLEWIIDSRCPLISTITLIYRIGAGWNPEKAITQKSERKNK